MLFLRSLTIKNLNNKYLILLLNNLLNSNNELNITAIDMQIRTSYNNDLIRIIKKLRIKHFLLKNQRETKMPSKNTQKREKLVLKYTYLSNKI
jgi:hypothetical protein